jgi:hypothetical protein
MREIFFHEDDYCQIEVLPLDNLHFCLEQAGAVEEFSAAHRSGAGWDAMYVRQASPTTVETLQISLAEIRATLSPALAEYDNVFTGYGSHKEKCSAVRAFGNDGSPTIFVALGPNDLVNAIWCSDPLIELQQLPRFDKLLLADWGWSFICPLQETSRLVGYMQERERSFRQMAEQWEAERKARESGKE